jgi:pimeloyl-ACP methyl ester carboxylesterase
LGSGERGTVLLAHGGGQTRHSWGATAKRLAELGWRSISIDLRGHGDSDWHPEGDYQALSIGEDLIDVVATLDEKPALIGASLGGIAGLMAEAVIAPGTFRSLTLVDIIPHSDPEGAAKILGFMSANAEQGFGSLQEAADAIAAYLPHRPKRTDLSGLSKNLRLRADGRYRWHWDPKFTNGVRGRATGSVDQRSIDFEAACSAIQIPVHVIRGRMSELVSLEAAQTFVATLKKGSLTDVSGAGHMVAGDRNDIFLEAVVAFLDRPEQRPG